MNSVSKEIQKRISDLENDKQETESDSGWPRSRWCTNQQLVTNIGDVYNILKRIDKRFTQLDEKLQSINERVTKLEEKTIQSSSELMNHTGSSAYVDEDWD